MRLSTKGRFAVSAMLDLALRQNNGPVTISTIGERQNISLSYLEQLFGKLRRASLVESVRGPGGGYMLARPTSEINVAEIVLAVDEPIDATQCAGRETCLTQHDPNQGPTRCQTHDLWFNLNVHIMTYLESVTLKSLVEANSARFKSGENKAQNAQPVKMVTQAIKHSAQRPSAFTQIPPPNSVFALGKKSINHSS